MKMREFLKQSFTNPFGNMLAITNLVMLISVELQATGINDKLISDLNRPAIFASHLLGGEFTAGLFVLQLVYLQWILIGGIAKFVGQTIRPDEID